MSVFRVEKTKGYTVMSNHHLRNHTLSLKAKGLLSQMLSLPDDWDYTLQGLAQINKESIDAIREAVRELERAGYIERSRERDERGCLRGTVYTIYEQPHTEPTSEKPAQALPTLDHPTLEKPMLDLPTLENPTQLNTESTKEPLNNRLYLVSTQCISRHLRLVKVISAQNSHYLSAFLLLFLKKGRLPLYQVVESFRPAMASAYKLAQANIAYSRFSFFFRPRYTVFL